MLADLAAKHFRQNSGGDLANPGMRNHHIRERTTASGDGGVFNCLLNMAERAGFSHRIQQAGDSLGGRQRFEARQVRGQQSDADVI